MTIYDSILGGKHKNWLSWKVTIATKRIDNVLCSAVHAVETHFATLMFGWTQEFYFVLFFPQLKHTVANYPESQNIDQNINIVFSPSNGCITDEFCSYLFPFLYTSIYHRACLHSQGHVYTHVLTHTSFPCSNCGSWWHFISS